MGSFNVQIHTVVPPAVGSETDLLARFLRLDDAFGWRVVSVSIVAGAFGGSEPLKVMVVRRRSWLQRVFWRTPGVARLALWIMRMDKAWEWK